MVEGGMGWKRENGEGKYRLAQDDGNCQCFHYSYIKNIAKRRERGEGRGERGKRRGERGEGRKKKGEGRREKREESREKGEGRGERGEGRLKTKFDIMRKRVIEHKYFMLKFCKIYGIYAPS